MSQDKSLVIHHTSHSDRCWWSRRKTCRRVKDLAGQISNLIFFFSFSFRSALQGSLRMVDRPRSRPKQASNQLFLQCVITVMNTYHLRTLQGLLQTYTVRGTPYTVHRTPYSGSPGAWPAPLARILPFRRYTPKTPKTPPSPPLLLTPRRAVRCPRSIFFKI